MPIYGHPYGTALTVYLPLRTFGTSEWRAAPTIAAGDIQISKDGGATFANPATLPSETAASSKVVKVVLTGTEAEGAAVIIRAIDQTATKEWEDTGEVVYTVTAVTAAAIADAVWDEARADHAAAGSFGQGAASVQGNVTGSVGSVTGAVGSVTGSVGSVTGAVGSVTGAVGSVTGAVGSVTGNVGGNVAGSVASVTGAVGSVAGNVGGNLNGNVVGSVATIGTDAISAGSFAADAITSTALAASAVTEIQSGLATAANLATAAASAATAATQATTAATQATAAAADALLARQHEEADETTDRTTDATHWQNVRKIKSTATEIRRKKMYEADGTTKVAADTQIVGQLTET